MKMFNYTGEMDKKFVEIMDEDSAIRDAVERGFMRILHQEVLSYLLIEAGHTPHDYRVFVECDDKRKKSRIEKVIHQNGFSEELKSRGGASYYFNSKVIDYGLYFLKRYPGTPEEQLEIDIESCLRSGRTRLFLNDDNSVSLASLLNFILRPDLYESGVVVHTVKRRFSGEEVETAFAFIKPIGLEQRLWDSQKEKVKSSLVRYNKNLYDFAEESFGTRVGDLMKEELPEFVDMNWENKEMSFGRGFKHKPESKDDAFKFVANLGQLITKQMEDYEQKAAELKKRADNLNLILEAVSCKKFVEFSEKFEKDINDSLESEKGIGWVSDEIDKNYKSTPKF